MMRTSIFLHYDQLLDSIKKAKSYQYVIRGADIESIEGVKQPLMMLLLF